jgi:hypothetical protein
MPAPGKVNPAVLAFKHYVNDLIFDLNHKPFAHKKENNNDLAQTVLSVSFDYTDGGWAL